MDRKENGPPPKQAVHENGRAAGRCFFQALLWLVPALLLLFCLPVHAQEAIFADISEESGLDFVHFNGMCGEYYFPEMTGQGGGFLDFDNDGDLDVYLVQGAVLGKGKTLADALFRPRDPNPRDRLFRNDLIVAKDGTRKVGFTDVTDQSGIAATEYGMGVCTGDFNNDGWIDLYVTNYGPNRMFYNNGDGTFSDVTKKTATGDDLWGASAAALDFDRDGWLDLYVTNYVHYDVDANKRCYANSSRRDYCGPAAFEPQKDRFFRNRGDGTFEDVTFRMLMDYQPGSGLGVVAADVNNDGWIDIYVANDGRPNQLWINQGGARFTEDALFSGTSVNQDGQAEASMGVDAGDFDGDGDLDFIVTHIMSESNTLYVNDGTGLFEDRTIAAGLAAASFPQTTFGTGWIDFNNDGWLDLLSLNGAVLVIEKLEREKDPYPLHQPNQLYRNDGGKSFTDITAQAGAAMKLSEVSRGGAFGDVDNDGDMDVLVFNNAGRVRLLMNNRGEKNMWLGVRLMDPLLKRDMLGARVVLTRKGKPDLYRRVRTDASYCSANDPRVLFGLGTSDQVESVTVFWPDGTRGVWDKPLSGRYTTLEKGKLKKEVR